MRNFDLNNFLKNYTMVNEKQFNFIKKYLEIHGFVCIDRENIREKVLYFQEKKRLVKDGILGPNTLWELQFEPTMDGMKIDLVRVEADKIEDSYNFFIIRKDIVENYNRVREEMIDKKAIMPSSGGLRSLNAKVYKGRSMTSFHYTGLALDFYIWSGLKNPDKDPFVLTLDREKSNFHIYARSNQEDFPRLSTVGYFIDQYGHLNQKEVNLPLFSFTDLLEKNGFNPISIYSSFFDDPKKNYLTSEWWHFQANSVLTEKCSLFGIELLKCHSLDKLKTTPPWQYREAVFYKNGFYRSPLTWLQF